VIDRVVTDLKAAGSCERKGEPLVVRILGCMYVTGSTIHLQAVTADSVITFWYCKNMFCYIIAV